MKSLRNHLPTAMDTILACSILHNIAVKWGIGEPDVDDDDEEEEQEVAILEEDELDNALIRARGSVLRENLRRQMPPPTESESRRLNL